MKLKISALTSKYLSVLAAMILFFIAFVAGSVLYRGFFSLQTFFNLFIDKAFLLVSATGMSLVILSGGIDLSVGSVLAFTTMVIASLTEFAHLSPALAVVIALAAGSLIGLCMGLMIAYWPNAYTQVKICKKKL
ncbi:hypothetical protein ACYULU_14575 [Breznakiellaceae bacterium SP9]